MRFAERMGARRQSGMTVLELLVTMVVAVILLGVGVPSFSSAILSTRMGTQASDFFGSVQRARSEAITRATPVTVCKSASGTSCTTAGNWEDGWIVFVDGNANAVVDAGDTVVRATPALMPGYTLRATTTFANAITFKGDGSAQGAGFFVLCRNSSTAQAKGINVNLVGRIANAADANNNGIPEDDTGGDYATCAP